MSNQYPIIPIIANTLFDYLYFKPNPLYSFDMKRMGLFAFKWGCAIIVQTFHVNTIFWSDFTHTQQSSKQRSNWFLILHVFKLFSYVATEIYSKLEDHCYIIIIIVSIITCTFILLPIFPMLQLKEIGDPNSTSFTRYAINSTICWKQQKYFGLIVSFSAGGGRGREMDVRKREDTVVRVVGRHDGLPCYIPLCADPKPPSTKYQGCQL